MRGFWASSVLFLLSGATGLAYEVLWFRRFAHIWGASSLALGAVVASFLLGLGIGAHLLGKRADRMAIPLRGYAWCEVGIGLLALLIPLELRLMSGVSAALYPLLESVPFLQFPVRLLLTFLVLGPPCVLMGGTFPLLVRQFTPAGDGAGASTGWLYAVNTIGAAAGCYLTGFHLLPRIGLTGTNWLAASLNVAVAVAAFLIARRLEPSVPAPAAPAPAAPAAKEPYALYWASALTGLAALLLQMVWTRQLCAMLGGSTYALSATLFVILLGIGLGSLLFRGWGARLADPARAGVIALGLVAVSAGAAKLLIPSLSVAVGLSRTLRSLELGNAAVCLVASAVLEFLPAVGMGFVFPLLVHLARRSPADTGRTVGTIYAWNTAGSIIGAAATAPVGLALLGSGWTMGLGLALYLVSAALLLPPVTLRKGAVFAAAALLTVAGIVMGAKRHDPRLTDEGFYLYGPRDPNERTVLYFKEGASCNVSVVDHSGGVSLAVNGKVDASNPGDMDMQLGLAYLPRFLRPQAKKLLVIGFGSGTTAGASLLFPGTKVTCCEIEPAVFAGSIHFEDANHMPAQNPNFTILFDDGRSHLQGTRETYDLILSEPSNPWLAGVSSLFTKEFYEVCREKLGEKGVLAQWIQLYHLSHAEYALVIRTVLEVFPHAALLRVSDGDSILMAGRAPFLPGAAEIDAAQALVEANTAIKLDLAKFYAETDVRSLLLTRLLLDEAGLRRAIAKTPEKTINTDLNLRLEFDAPLRLFHSDLNPEEDLDPTVVQASEGAWFRRMVAEWGCAKPQVKALRSLAKLLVANRKHDVGEEVLDLAGRLDPDDPTLLADRTIARRGENPEAVEREFMALLERSPEEAVRVGHDLWRAAKYALAASLFEKMVAKFPASTTAWHELAMNYERLAEWDKGEEAYKKVLSLDPLNDTLRTAAESFRRERIQRTKK